MPRLCIMPARALEDDRLSNQDLRALLAVGYHASLDGKGVWASNRTLAERARLDDRDFRRAVARLIEYGYVIRRARVSPDGRQQTSYTDVVLDEERGGGVIDPGGEGCPHPGGGGVPVPHQTRTEERRHKASSSPARSVPDCLVAEHHRIAYRTLLDGNPRARASIDYELRLAAEGGERPGVGLVPATGWERVGEALHQLVTMGRVFSSRTLGTFIGGLDPLPAAPAKARAAAPAKDYSFLDAPDPFAAVPL